MPPPSRAGRGLRAGRGRGASERAGAFRRREAALAARVPGGDWGGGTAPSPGERCGGGDAALERGEKSISESLRPPVGVSLSPQPVTASGRRRRGSSCSPALGGAALCSGRAARHPEAVSAARSTEPSPSCPGLRTEDPQGVLGRPGSLLHVPPVQAKEVIVACLQCIQHIRTSWLYGTLIRPSWSLTLCMGMDGFSSSPHWSNHSEVSLRTWWEEACAQGFLLLSSTLPQRTAAPPEKYTFLNTPCLSAERHEDTGSYSSRYFRCQRCSARPVLAPSARSPGDSVAPPALALTPCQLQLM
ncbi:uncharacterized protein LOC135986932 [Caloenas nicobarica]|uniref:uncharacterized protein LOC135986932 n=1 Tax=Caloenas nicobarica TaxID=187106 RepID=UPI0032B86507